jgi:predicted component of viral defense system (DUF524 family)
MFKIYEDRRKRVLLANNFLYENTNYYLFLDSPNDPNLEQHLHRSGLSRHISWHPGNRIAELRVENYIGLIRIFDKEFDVRSKKFDRSKTGAEQLQCLIKDLDSISRGVSFSYDSSLYNPTTTDWDIVQNDQIHKLNYLYQVFYEIEVFNTVINLMEKIKRNPSLQHEVSHQNKALWEVKKVSSKTLQQLAKAGFKKGSKEINSTILVDHHVLSNNTTENQFVKMFFVYVRQIALNVLSYKSESVTVNEKALALLNTCRLILSDPFFDKVDDVTKTAPNSTVLHSRDGYSQLQQYFTNSIFSVTHIFNDFKNTLTTDLLDVAMLYEIWCFYTLSVQLLGNEILVSQKSSIIKDNQIRYSTSFENKDYKVYYNRSFSVSKKSSYSTTLRPDITVEDKKSGILYHFDAKYRINSLLGQAGVEHKTFKNDDINKMHAYLDALYKTSSSIVLYPGNHFKFFVKSDPPKVITSLSEDFVLEGVGAIPISPGTKNEVLILFLKKFFANQS